MVKATKAPNETLPPTSPADYTLYTVNGKYYMRPKSAAGQEREISKREYDDLLETKNNNHQRIHK